MRWPWRRRGAAQREPPSESTELSAVSRALEEKLRTELAAIAAGKPPDDEVSRLKDALDASRALLPPHATPWWSTRLIPPALLALTAALVALLLGRAGRAEIEVELVASAIEVEVLQGRDLLGVRGEVTPVHRFSAHGWRYIHTPAPVSASQARSATIAPIADAATLGVVTVDYLKVPARSRVVVHHSSVPPAVRVRVRSRDDVRSGDDVEAKLTAVGPYELSLGGGTASAGDGAIVFLGEEIDLEFQAASQTLAIAEQVPIARVDLDERLDFQTQAATSFDVVSRVRSGTIAIRDIDRKVELRPGDLLRVEFTDGLLRHMTIDEDGIHVALHASASRLELGSSRRDLRPSRLAILHAAEGLKVFVLAVLWLFGLALATWKWWQKGGEP